MTARDDVTTALLAYLDSDVNTKEFLQVLKKADNAAARTLYAALLVYYASL